MASQSSKSSGSRRLPPLATSYKPRGAGRIARSPISSISSGGAAGRDRRVIKHDMVVTGHSPVNSGGQSVQSTGSNDGIHSPTGAGDMTSSQATQFLHDNPEFLDMYVHQYVHRTRLDKWASLKSRSRKEPDESPQRQQDFSEKWQTCLHTSKHRRLQDLIKDFHIMANKEHVLFELGNCIASAINADGVNMYLVEREGTMSCYKSPNYEKHPHSPVPIERGVSIAGYVAVSKESVRVTQVDKLDTRFARGVTVADDAPETVIALPILSTSGDILGVAELYRHRGSPHFSLQDEEVAMWHISWTDVILQHCELYNSMTRQRKLNDFLLTVTKSIFQDIVSMDTVIMKIMTYAKRLVNADRASLFLLDTRTNELYARIFDTGTRESTEPNPIFQKEIRFPIDRGVAGHVATTGEILNIPDAYLDDRFNRDVDLQTGYTTRTILCMPIYIRGSIIGVVQMVNKLNGTFTKSDEESFETFAIYCGLALHHAKLYDKIRKSEQKYRVALEVLSYHSQASEEEIESLEYRSVPDTIPDIANYDFSPWGVTNEEKPTYIIYMFKDLFNLTRFDVTDLIRFTLTVRKNYRNVPYHNWTHAFSVAHAMYTIIQTSQHNFSGLESLALFVACMCHDLDHRGKTNAFMVKSASPLAAVYSTSTMEHHHFNQTVTILQHEGHNIFKHMTSEEYKQVLSDIRHCILATDLALFFGNKAKLQEISDNKAFDWKNSEHRQLIMSVTMTASDLCAMYKDWDLQYKLVHIIMEEFWQQGDEEREQGKKPPPMMDRCASSQLPQYQGDVEKEQGVKPLPMMDRDKRDELPQLEVGFIVGICLPCYDLLAQIIPETRPMADGAMTNLKRWQHLADECDKASAEGKDNFTKTQLPPVDPDEGERTLEITRDTKSNLLIGKLSKMPDTRDSALSAGSYTKGDNQNKKLMQT